MAAVPFLEGVEGGGGSRDEPDIDDVRGRFTDIESAMVSVVLAGRFFACAGGASELTERSCRVGSFRGGKAR